MKRIFLAVIIFITGCTTVPKAEVEAAECHLFPHFKTISQPEYAMRAAERQKAIREWHKEAGTAWAGGILYELVVDGQGNVVKIRVAQPLFHDDAEQYFTRNFLRIVQGYKFRADAVPSAYRTFYYPLLLERTTDIHDWLGD